MSILMIAGLSTGDGAHAAGAGWYGQSAPGKRPHFRPVSRVSRLPVRTRWRPQSAQDRRRTSYATGGSAAAWSRVNRVREPVIAGAPIGARNPALARRPASAGTAFRPDRRNGAPVGGTGTEARAGASWLHAQHRSRFRPTPAKRRVTYEELHPAPASAPLFVAPQLAYQTAHVGIVGAYLPRWGW